MKRDMELVREILLCVEKGEGLAALTVKHGSETVAGHVAILNDAEMVKAAIAENNVGIPMSAHIIRLTWAGHEFLDNARDNAVWKKVMKSLGGKVASVSFSVLTECLKRAVLAQVGLS